MENDTSSRQLHFGDLIYIEINILNPTESLKNLVLVSNGFMDCNIYATSNHDMQKAQFMNCVFKVLPPIIDDEDEKELLKDLESDLKLFDEQDNDAMHIIRKNIDTKKDQLKIKNKSTEKLNEKIMKETEGKEVRYGESIILQHYLSKQYLRTRNYAHPLQKNIMDLSLSKAHNRECYFKILPTHHGIQSDTVEYEIEINIISFSYGSHLVVGTYSIPSVMKTFDENIENDDIFPYESIRRLPPVQSFISNKNIIGVKFEKETKNPIKLYPYSRYTDLIYMSKNKIIKNGDLIRISRGDYYLTASKSCYKSTFSLNNQKLSKYPMHMINTLFQVISIPEANSSPYPAGEPIYSNSKKNLDPSDASSVWIKHFVSGDYLLMNRLFNYDIGSFEDDEAQMIPIVNLVHNSDGAISDSATQAVYKNSLLAIQSLSRTDKEGMYLVEGELEPHVNNENEKNTGYYMGSNDSENYIKETIKLTKKFVGIDSANGTFFRISSVSKNSVENVLLCESYANHVKSFFTVLMSYKNKRKCRNKVLNKSISDMIYNTKKFLISMCTDETEDSLDILEDFTNIIKYDELQLADVEKQIYLREFKIFDAINRLIYYLAADNFEIFKDGYDDQDELLDLDLVYELINLSILTILIGIKDNMINHRYNTQYIRVYLHSVISMKGLMVYMEEDKQDQLKGKFIKLLYEVLWDEDVDSLNSLKSFQEKIFENIYSQRGLGLHYIDLLNHISKSRAPNLVNTIRDNFITNYLTDYEKRRSLLPQIDEDGMMYISKTKNEIGKSEVIQVNLKDSEDTGMKYILNVIQLLNSLSLKKSLLFYQLIIKTYPFDRCKKFLDYAIDNNSAHQINDEFKKLVKNVYGLYKSVPINVLPKNVQFIFRGFEEYEKKVNELIDNGKKMLIDNKEIEILARADIDIKTLDLMNLKNPDLEMEYQFKRGVSDKKKSEEEKFEDYAFNINNMYNLLNEHKYVDKKILLDIHESLCKILVLLVNKKGNKEEEQEQYPTAIIDSNNSNFLNEHSKKIFRIINHIDDHIADSAILEYISKLREFIINRPQKAKDTIIDNEAALDEIMKQMIHSDWRTKVCLYKNLSRPSTHPQTSTNTINEPNKKVYTRLANTEIGLEDDDKVFLEDKFIQILSDLIEIGNISVVSLAIKALQRKAQFQTRVFSELRKWSLITNPSDGEEFINLVKCLFEINKISRRIQLVTEFNQPKINGQEQEMILKQLREYFEDMICILYDYKIHIKDCTEDVRTPREIFLSRLEASKKDLKNEVPFVWRQGCIHTQYQYVMQILNSREILVPFIKILYYNQNYFEKSDPEFILLLRYLALIIILYLHKNPDNQTNLSTDSDFIRIYYDIDIINASAEILMMFTEMINGNKELLKLKKKYLIDITSNNYIKYLNSFSILKNPDIADSPLPINYIRSLPFIFNSGISKDIFDPNKYMVKKFDDMLKFTETDMRIKLENILSNNFNISTTAIKRNTTIDIDDGYKQYKVPILYLMWKELLYAERDFSKSDDKKRIIYLQGKFPMSKFIRALTNESFEFQFELKGLVLQWMNNLYYKNYNKPNVFDDENDEFEIFIGHLLLDISAFIYLQDNKWDIFINKSCFFKTLPNISGRGRRLLYLMDIYDLKKVIYMEFQYDIKFEKEWENYIYQNIMEIMLKIIIHEKVRLLRIKDKQNIEYDSLFKVWFALLQKLISLQKNMSLMDKSIDILKALSIIPEYKDFHDSAKDSISALSSVKNRENSVAIPSAKDETFLYESIDLTVSRRYNYGKAFLTNRIHQYIEKSLVQKKLYFEDNLSYIAKAIADHEGCIAQLINFVSSSNSSKKENLFTLRLLRKIIEIQNVTLKDKETPIYEWEEVDSETFENISKIQKLLNNKNIVAGIFNILYNSNNPRLLKECLLLSISLLYGGNKEIQDKFYQEFMEDTENEIMTKLSKALSDNLDSIFMLDSKRNKTNYLIAQNFIYEYISNRHNPENKKLEELGKEIIRKELLNLAKLDQANNLDQTKSDQVELTPAYKKLLAKEFYNHTKNVSKIENEVLHLANKGHSQKEYVLVMLFFLQSLCEGHYLPFQNFLREQHIPDKGPMHPKSFNILGYMRYAYNEIFKVINTHNIKIGIKILDLLIEALQGECEENTELLLRKTLLTDLSQTLVSLNNDIDLLSRGFGFDNHHHDFQELKSKVLTLFLNIVEKGNDETKKILNRFVDFDVIVEFTISNLIEYAKTKGQYPRKENLIEDEIHKNIFLMDGITGYIVLRNMWKRGEFEKKMRKLINIYQQKNNEDLKLIEYMIFTFCDKYILSIEIRKKSGQILRIYFPKIVVFDYLSQDIKDDFEQNVDRSNTQTKIEEFFTKCDEFSNQAQLDYNSRNKLFGLNMNSIYTWMRLIADALALTANFINMFSLTFMHTNGSTNNNANSTNGNTSGSDQNQNFEGYVDQDYSSYLAVVILNAINSLLALLLIILWFYVKCNKYLSHRWEADYDEVLKEVPDLPTNFDNTIAKALEKHRISVEDAIKVLDYKEPFSDIWKLASKTAREYYLKRKFIYLIGSSTLIWHLIFLGLCIGASFHPIVCALTLFDIVVRSDTVSRILASVSRNLNQFLWTVMLLLIVVYIYSLIGLYYLQDAFTDGESNTKLCSDGYACFLVNFNFGLRSGGGIADNIQSVIYDSDNRGYYFARTVYDLSFFVICIILLLNLIFGMIIDSFGDLRDEKNKNEDDQKNTCFICGMNRSEIERYFNFDDHIQLEHNKWNYLAYLIYLTKKEEYAPTEFSDIESYVLDRYKKLDFEWVPVRRSLTLEKMFQQDEKSKKSELEAMQEEMTTQLLAVSTENKNISDYIKYIKEDLTKMMFGKRGTSSVLSSLPKKIN